MNTNRKNNQSTAKECGILGCVISGRRFDVKTIGSMSHMTVPAQQAVFDYLALIIVSAIAQILTLKRVNLWGTEL